MKIAKLTGQSNSHTQPFFKVGKEQQAKRRPKEGKTRSGRVW